MLFMRIAKEPVGNRPVGDRPWLVKLALAKRCARSKITAWLPVIGRSR